jgi:HEAT repeat protein
MKALNDSDPEILNAALTAMPRLEAKALPGLPRLLSLIETNQGNARWRAISALRELGPESAPKAVPVLTKYLETGPPSERRVIMAALENMGPSAKSAIPALKKIAADSTDTSSLEAQRILRQWNQTW